MSNKKLFKVNIFKVEVEEKSPPEGKTTLEGKTTPAGKTSSEGDTPRETIPPLPFDEAIMKAKALSTAKNRMLVNGKTRGLEMLSKGSNCLLINFVTLDYSGPGKSRTMARATHFELQPDEFFAEETSMLYDTKTKIAFVEASQGGMAAGAIEKYFGMFANRSTEYWLTPLLDEDAASRARLQKHIRSLQVRVAIGSVTSADRQSDLGVIDALGSDYGAGFVDLEISAGPARSDYLTLESITKFLTRGLRASNQGSVKKLKMHSKKNSVDRLEVIDLLQHREKRETKLPIDSEERKIPFDARCNALKDIRKQFYIDVPQN